VPERSICRNFLDRNLVKRELLFTIGAFSVIFVVDNEQVPAIGTGFFQWFFPGGKFTFRVVRATVKSSPLPSFSFYNLTPIQGAGDTNFLQKWFRVAAFREITAADELAIASPADD
jgi:hypothetical protein